MTSETRLRTARNLAGIEGDLVAAEQAFEDADSRFRKAKTDRQNALENINKHQVELDKFISELRQSSVPGTVWSPQPLEAEAIEEALELHREDIVADDANDDSAEEGLTSSEAKKALAKDFKRLRESSTVRDEDPVLKVVAGPRG